MVGIKKVFKKMNLNKKKQSALFISYDGLQDPLGQSQILPYLKIISKSVSYLHVLTFEKNISNEECIKLPNNISWTQLSFSKGGVFSKIKDLTCMFLIAIKLMYKFKFNILHARSYPSMHTAYLLSKFFDIKLIFDMRGFWADDRVEGSIWKQKKIYYRLIYKYYKSLEKKFLKKADKIVVLTSRVVPEIMNISQKLDRDKIIIIPCCADYNHFKPLSLIRKRVIKDSLKIPINSKVICYLGSLGTIYLFDAQIKLFYELVKNNKKDNYIFLLITKNWNESYKKKIINLGFKSILEKIIIISASRNQVPLYLGISDLLITFRMNSYSQIAASPTKIAEAFAMGVPIITNKGIGDIDEILNQFKGGITLDYSNKMEVYKFCKNIKKLIALGGRRLRNTTKKHFDLGRANDGYTNLYCSLSE